MFQVFKDALGIGSDAMCIHTSLATIGAWLWNAKPRDWHKQIVNFLTEWNSIWCARLAIKTHADSCKFYSMFDKSKKVNIKFNHLGAFLRPKTWSSRIRRNSTKNSDEIPFKRRINGDLMNVLYWFRESNVISKQNFFHWISQFDNNLKSSHNLSRESSDSGDIHSFINSSIRIAFCLLFQFEHNTCVY